MVTDDMIRSKRGLVVCLRDMGNGTSKLFFDDVIEDHEKDPITWSHGSFYTTSPEFQNSELDGIGISEAQLKDIGFALVVRLVALNGRIK